MRISLAEAHPELVAEWSVRNLPLTPTDVTRGSNKKVWWRAACGHEWQGIVKNRVNGHGCPYCAGNAVLAGYNDLASRYPGVAAEWSARNLPLLPSQVTKRSVQKVWWRDSFGHEWQARIADRVEGHGCPYCNDGKLLTGFNDLASCFPEIAAEWSESNFPLKPEQVKPKSRQPVWWRCAECGHEWKAVINTRVLGGQSCPACARELRRRKNAWKYDKPFLTRLPLEVFSYYAKKSGLEVRRYDDEEVGLPLAVYLPEVKMALETSRTVEGRMEERIKNELCWRARIRLIRIVEPCAAEYDNCKCIRICDTSISSLNLALDMVFRLIGVEAAVDVERDVLKVYQDFRPNWSTPSI